MTDQTSPPLPVAPVVSQTVSPLDAETHDLMAAALIERGIISAEQAAISRINLTGEQSTAEAPAGQKVPAASQAGSPTPNPATASPEGTLDAQIFEGAANPAAYQFTTFEPPEGVEHSLEFESVNRAALHHASVPREIGNEIARRWNEAMARDEVSEQDLALSKQSALTQLNKVWGADTMRNVALAETVIAKIAEKQPGVWDMLRVSGLANDPWLIQTLYNLARAQQGRR
jgi:hypothetical protein